MRSAPQTFTQKRSVCGCSTLPHRRPIWSITMVTGSAVGERFQPAGRHAAKLARARTVSRSASFPDGRMPAPAVVKRLVVDIAADDGDAWQLPLDLAMASSMAVVIAVAACLNQNRAVETQPAMQRRQRFGRVHRGVGPLGATA